jgi:hypothetical protein
MQSYQNKCGKIEWGLDENGQDYYYCVYDERGNKVNGREAIHAKMQQITNEKFKNIRTSLIDLMMGNGPELSFELMEDIMQKLGESLYLRDGILRDFYDVFEEIVGMLSLIKDE